MYRFLIVPLAMHPDLPGQSTMLSAGRADLLGGAEVATRGNDDSEFVEVHVEFGWSSNTFYSPPRDPKAPASKRAGEEDKVRALISSPAFLLSHGAAALVGTSLWDQSSEA